MRAELLERLYELRPESFIFTERLTETISLDEIRRAIACAEADLKFATIYWGD